VGDFKGAEDSQFHVRTYESFLSIPGLRLQDDVTGLKVTKFVQRATNHDYKRQSRLL